jgi:hypothetical protein
MNSHKPNPLRVVMVPSHETLDEAAQQTASAAKEEQ